MHEQVVTGVDDLLAAAVVGLEELDPGAVQLLAAFAECVGQRLGRSVAG